MFSELVDRCVSIAGRPDQLASMVFAANETMRTISKRGNWPDDTLEEQVIVDPTSDVTIWTPECGRGRFRREEYIEDGTGAEPTAVRPSRRVKDLSFYYYRSGDSFVFKGACSHLNIYYYAYQPWLQYFPIGARPTSFDIELGAFTDPDPAAVALVSNWMLERHTSTVEAGTLQRFFASKQDARQALFYSIFEAGINDIQRAEGVEELLGRRRG